MMAETTIVGIDVSRDSLDGFHLPGQKRFRHPNTGEGLYALVAVIRQMLGQVKLGFEAIGGHEWVLSARQKQRVSASFESLDDDLQDVFDAQISVIERRIEDVIAQTGHLAVKGAPTEINPRMRHVSAAMLITELP